VTEAQFLQQVQIVLTWANVRRWRAGEYVSAPRASGYAFWLIRNGVIEVEVGDAFWRVGEGEALILPPDIIRDRIAAPNGADWVSVGINARLFGRLDVFPLFAPPRQWRPAPEIAAQLSLWMEQASDNWCDMPRPNDHPLLVNRRARDAASQMVSDGLAQAIFGTCWRSLRGGNPAQTIPLATALPGAPEWFLDVLGRVQLEPGISAAELCRAYHVSPAHLRRAFHRYLDQSPQDYLTERRLEEARRLLETTELSVVTIAAEVGFESLSHFTRLFKHRYQEPPARYRHLFAHPNI
jgi:AraC-like DNA-binding protein